MSGVVHNTIEDTLHHMLYVVMQVTSKRPEMIILGSAILNELKVELEGFSTKVQLTGGQMKLYGIPLREDTLNMYTLAVV